MSIPKYRPRRLRRGDLLREFAADVTLTPSDFIMPVFVKHGAERTAISSMPGIEQLSPESALKYIEDLTAKGIKQYILFGVFEPHEKDEHGTVALDANNPVNATMRMVKEAGVDAMLVADLCFCEFTSHGHCGALSEDPEMTVDNDKTLEMLAEQARVLASCGADIVAPSGMMDGMVGAIREGLDTGGFQDTAIMSYSVKYASSMYGPFRDAAQGAPTFGDRRGYQMDYRRSDECLTEVELDIQEGADLLMVKPGATYLDVIQKVASASELPVGAFHVSGEYSMLHAAAERGWLDLKSAALEISYAIKRSGASFILSYFSKDMPVWL